MAGWEVTGIAGRLSVFERAFQGDAIEQALREVGEYILEESSRQVPLEVGDLQDSGRVTVDGNTVAVSYDTPYAVRQHEEMDYRHDAGRKAKYLEDPMNAAAQGPAQHIIGERLGREFK